MPGSEQRQRENPPPKRRRILDPSSIVPVPVYSNKVSSSLLMKPPAALLTEDEVTEDKLLSDWFRGKGAGTITLSDSEDDDGEEKEAPGTEARSDDARCPSPPPSPESPVQKPSRKVQKKIRELDRNLQAAYSLMSPEPPRTTRGSRGRTRPGRAGEDDVIIESPASEASHGSPCDSPCGSPSREIPLKIRCRTEVHKVPVLSSTSLSAVVTRLSVLLEVPPTRLLLLRGDAELPTDSTVGELGLGIADIIECAVMAAEEEKSHASDGDDLITLKLQSKDRDALLEFSLLRAAPLGPIFSQYVSQLPAGAQTNVRFHFDGGKVTARQTPAELDMEDGDIIEVWI